jgi:acetate---CoA ligase (ADP-forming)
MNYLFYPKTVAIVGVSRTPKSIGREILKNLIQFNYDGRIYPVNPKAFSINSLRCYPSLTDIPEEQIDLVVIVVPSQFVKPVIQEAVSLKVKSAVIITAGFREIGEQGLKLEEEIYEMSNSINMRIIGPNCMGILNGHHPHLNATFAPIMPLTGELGFISQSGALGVVVMEYASGLKLGFSKFVSLGNKMDVNDNMMLEYLAKDEDTKVILAYLEAFSDPKNFSNIAFEASKKKPVLMLKSGRTTAGAKAASSHTGALAGKENVIAAALAKSGVIRVESVEELFDSAMGFLKCNLPNGNKVAILTNAGGPGTLATDALVYLDLKIADLNDETKFKLREVIPPEASPENPVDLIASADADRYAKSLKLLLEDENVDMVLIIFVPPLMIQTIEVANAVNEILQTIETEKPVISCFMGRNVLLRQETTFKFPIYEFPENAARVMNDLWSYSKWKQKEHEYNAQLTPKTVKLKAKKIIQNCLKAESEWMEQNSVQELLELYGFNFPESRYVKSFDELLEAVEEISFPVVVKLASTKITHKTDKGGVFLDVRTNDELINAWKQISKVYVKAKILEVERIVLVQKFYKSGVEIALGTSYDKQFGQTIMIGSGGVLIEILKDVHFRLTPINNSDAKSMIKSLRGYPLLLGYRGEPEADIDALEVNLIQLSNLVEDFPEILELDINPILVLPKGEKPIVLDARIKM